MIQIESGMRLGGDLCGLKLNTIISFAYTGCFNSGGVFIENSAGFSRGMVGGGWGVCRENKTHIPPSSGQASSRLREREREIESNVFLFLWKIMRLILFRLIFSQTKHMVCVSANTFPLHLNGRLSSPRSAPATAQKQQQAVVILRPLCAVRHDWHLSFFNWPWVKQRLG